MLKIYYINEYKLIIKMSRLLPQLYLRIEFVIQWRDGGLATAVEEVDLDVGIALGRRARGQFRVPSSPASRVAGVVAVFQQHSTHTAVIIGPAMTAKTVFASLLSHLI